MYVARLMNGITVLGRNDSRDVSAVEGVVVNNGRIGCKVVARDIIGVTIAVVVNAMQSQVTEDLKDEGEAHTRLILDEVRSLRREIEALRRPSPS